MTLQLKLPKDLEQRLLDEVKAGRHGSLEEVILERLSRRDDPELLAATAQDIARIRHDLDQAWDDRKDAVDGEAVFQRIAQKSARLRADGK